MSETKRDMSYIDSIDSLIQSAANEADKTVKRSHFRSTSVYNKIWSKCYLEIMDRLAHEHNFRGHRKYGQIMKDLNTERAGKIR